MNVFSSRRGPEESAAKCVQLDRDIPGWRDMKYPNGKPKFDADGTMLTRSGNRSIFDDMDD